MTITIDNTQVEIFPEDNNIVDISRRAKIGIPAPCYRSKQNKGCCMVCIVEINGEKAYACCTKPVEGMNVIVKREDLESIRTERLKDYQEKPINEVTEGDCSCDCGCNTSLNQCC